MRPLRLGTGKSFRATLLREKSDEANCQYSDDRGFHARSCVGVIRARLRRGRQRNGIDGIEFLFNARDERERRDEWERMEPYERPRADRPTEPALWQSRRDGDSGQF